MAGLTIQHSIFCILLPPQFKSCAADANLHKLEDSCQSGCFLFVCFFQTTYPHVSFVYCILNQGQQRKISAKFQNIESSLQYHKTFRCLSDFPERLWSLYPQKYSKVAEMTLNSCPFPGFRVLSWTGKWKTHFTWYSRSRTFS